MGKSLDTTQRDRHYTWLVAEHMTVDDAAEQMFSEGLKGWKTHEKARVAAEAERKAQEAADRKRKEEAHQAALREQEIRRRLILKQQEFEATQVASWRAEIEAELAAHHKK